MPDKPKLLRTGRASGAHLVADCWNGCNDAAKNPPDGELAILVRVAPLVLVTPVPPPRPAFDLGQRVAKGIVVSIFKAATGG